MAERRRSRTHQKSTEKPVRTRRKSGRDEKELVHLTASDRNAGEWFAKLVALQERLCAPNGCPWDREQTHASLRRYLIEEAYEVLEAMESGDQEEFASELGDLMLQIVFHSVLAESAAEFTISDVIEAIFTKMVRRHPHVFGDARAETSGAVLKKWEEIKAQERARKRGTEEEGPADESVLSGVSKSLPAVLEAYQLTRRASHIGFDWPDLQGIFDKIDEEKRELTELAPAGLRNANIPQSSTKAKKSIKHSARAEEEVGDLLFATVNVARFLGVDPEIALKKANRKFKERFQWMENEASRQQGRLADASRERMEELWDEAKKSTARSMKSVADSASAPSDD